MQGLRNAKAKDCEIYEMQALRNVKAKQRGPRSEVLHVRNAREKQFWGIVVLPEPVP